MIAFNVDFIALTHAWLAVLYRASWQGAIAIGLVWCLCRWARRMPPSVRCWLWRLVLVKFLIVVLWPGSIDLAWLPRSQIGQPFVPAGSHDLSPAIPTRTGRNNSDNPPPASASKSWGIPLGGVLWGAWASGVVIVATLLIARARAVRRWRKQCVMVKDADILTLCEALSGELGIYQPPVLFACDACEGPVVFGALRTSVVLPARLLDHADLSRLRLILRHELAHIHRGDLLWNWVATVVCGLFFFHPLVWVALRELRLSQELACDACAIEPKDASLADYGTLLLELAGRSRAPSNILMTVGVVESFEFLKRRLTAMSELSGPTRWTRPMMAMLLPIVVVGLLPWRLVAKPAQTQTVGTTAASVTTPNSKGQTSPVRAYKAALENVRRTDAKQASFTLSGIPLGDRQKEMAERLLDENLAAQSRAGAKPGWKRYVVSIGSEAYPNSGGRGGRMPNELDSPDLQPYLKLELGNFDDPQGDGSGAFHLRVPDRAVRGIQHLAGESPVDANKRQTTSFASAELDNPPAHELAGLAVRLDERQRNDSKGQTHEPRGRGYVSGTFGFTDSLKSSRAPDRADDSCWFTSGRPQP